MTTPTLEIGKMHALQILEEASRKLATADGEVTLDFSAIQRMDSELLQRVELLVSVAEQRAARITLRNVSIDVYKVLKLMKLTRLISFVN